MKLPDLIKAIQNQGDPGLIARLAARGSDLDEVLCEAVSQAFGTKDEAERTLLIATLQQRGFVLLADSLDEAPEREPLFQALLAWQQFRPEIKLVIAGRKYGFPETAVTKGAQNWLDVVPLKPRERRKIVEIGGEGLDQDILKKTATRRDIQSITEVPFLLGAILKVAKSEAGRSLLQREFLTPALVLDHAISTLYAEAHGCNKPWALVGGVSLVHFLRVLQGGETSLSQRSLTVRNFKDFGTEAGIENLDQFYVAWLDRFHRARILSPAVGDLVLDTCVLETGHLALWEYLAGRALAEAIRRGTVDLDLVEAAAWAPEFEEVLVYASDCLVNVLPAASDKFQNSPLRSRVDSFYRTLSREGKAPELLGVRDKVVWLCVATCPEEFASETVRSIARGIVDRRLVELAFVSNDFDQEMAGSLPRAGVGLGARAKWIRGSEGVSRKILSLLSGLIGDEDLYVRKAAAQALGQVVVAVPEKGDKVLSLLSGLILGEDPRGNVRQTVANSLGQVVVAVPEKGDEVLSLLTGLIGGEDVPLYVREAVALALGQVVVAVPEKGDEVLSLLTGLIGDKVSGVRKTVAQALGQVVVAVPEKGDEVLSLLTGLIEDEVSDVREAAVQALGQVVAAVPGLRHRVDLALRGMSTYDLTWVVTHAKWQTWGNCTQASISLRISGVQKFPQLPLSGIGSQEGSDHFAMLGFIPRLVLEISQDPTLFSNLKPDDWFDSIWLVHRFWREVTSGPKETAIRFFESSETLSPPGESQLGFTYLRTVEELLVPLHQKVTFRQL
ncbi:MAG: HEAT repeat domain-containing protein [Fimbriimonadaceae bacterium]|nr:HEAT repeat domain-containing protein [Fimbriimonadaceae bacterium]